MSCLSLEFSIEYHQTTDDHGWPRATKVVEMKLWIRGHHRIFRERFEVLTKEKSSLLISQRLPPQMWPLVPRASHLAVPSPSTSVSNGILRGCYGNCDLASLECSWTTILVFHTASRWRKETCQQRSLPPFPSRSPGPRKEPESSRAQLGLCPKGEPALRGRFREGLPGLPSTWKWLTAIAIALPW